MYLSDMISELGSELNRSDIDARIKRWIQQSIDAIFVAIVTKSLEKSATLTATADTATMALPTDFGEALELRYTPGDGSGYQLRRVYSNDFFAQNPDQDNSGFPEQFCIFGGKIYLAPLPASAYSFTLTYRAASVNIYTHALNFTDSDTAATTGVQVYLDEDAVETGIGKLYFVSPTGADATIQLASADGHVHDVTIYDNDDAATDGVAIYFDEDGATADERISFVSPTGQDCVVQSGNYREHNHYIQVKDKDNAASLGVAIYCDEDATSKSGRLLFVSPTDANGTADLVLAKDGTIPPFVERYHEVIFLGALARGLRYEQKYQESVAVQRQLTELMGGIVQSESRRSQTVFEAKSFGSGAGRDPWGSWRFPEITS